MESESTSCASNRSQRRGRRCNPVPESPTLSNTEEYTFRNMSIYAATETVSEPQAVLENQSVVSPISPNSSVNVDMENTYGSEVPEILSDTLHELPPSTAEQDSNQHPTNDATQNTVERPRKKMEGHSGTQLLLVSRRLTFTNV